MRILFATHNQHKLREIQEILSNFPGTILCAKDLGMDQEVEENGTSFLENAEIKARALYNFAKAQGLLEEDDLVMADDSGLSIEALSFGPGIYSARFLGVDTPYLEKNRRILAMMEESSSHCCDFCGWKAFANGSQMHGRNCKRARWRRGLRL